jgi:hypothetical protein
MEALHAPFSDNLHAIVADYVALDRVILGIRQKSFYLVASAGRHSNTEPILFVEAHGTHTNVWKAKAPADGSPKAVLRMTFTRQIADPADPTKSITVGICVDGTSRIIGQVRIAYTCVGLRVLGCSVTCHHSPIAP